MTDLPAALASADAFIGCLLDDPTERGLEAAVRAVPDGPGALRAVLHDRFAHAGEGFGALEGDPLFWRVVVIATTTWSADERRRFADETLFHAAAPDGYRWIAPIVRALFTPEEAERRVLAVLERGEPAARLNASHLAYVLFQEDPAYALSATGAVRLKASDPYERPA